MCFSRHFEQVPLKRSLLTSILLTKLDINENWHHSNCTTIAPLQNKRSKDLKNIAIDPFSFLPSVLLSTRLHQPIEVSTSLLTFGLFSPGTFITTIVLSLSTHLPSFLLLFIEAFFQIMSELTILLDLLKSIIFPPSISSCKVIGANLSSAISSKLISVILCTSEPITFIFYIMSGFNSFIMH